jgi:hypothetical protein
VLLCRTMNVLDRAVGVEPQDAQHVRIERSKGLRF